MIIIIGLVILIAAVAAGAAGVLSNSGSGHPLTHPFAILGYHVTGSTGTLFLYRILVGALALFGLSLLLAGPPRASRALSQPGRETAAVSHDRDDLLDQRETARAYSASTMGNGLAGDGGDPGTDASGSQRVKWHLFGPRSASTQAATPPGPAVNGHAPDIPADASAAPD